MAIFKRRAAIIDLTGHGAASVCPRCGGPGSNDYVDLVLQVSQHTCRRCATLWETPVGHRLEV